MGHAIRTALHREEDVCEVRLRILRSQLAAVEERLQLLRLALLELDDERERSEALAGDAR